MKTLYVFLAAACAFVLGGCTNEMESGKGYPALETGDATLVFKLDKVMQNDTDVKPYFDFFDGVTLTLTYRDNKPATLTFSQEGGSVPRDGEGLYECRMGDLLGQHALRDPREGERRGDLLHDARPARHLPLPAGRPLEQVRIPAPAR